MRSISVNLAAVQKVRSPRARVTVTVEAPGLNPALPRVAWAELVGNVGQVTHWPTTVVGRADGSVLKFVANSTHIVQYTIATPTSAASWTGASGTNRVTGMSFSVAALRVPGSSTIRLFYLLSGNVLYIESTNNGSTWGGAVTVYSGGNAVSDLVVAYIADGSVANGPWFVGFSTLATGIYSARFGYFSGSWLTHAYGETGWRAAGIDAYAPAAARHRVLVFRQRGQGTSRLRIMAKTGSVFSSVSDIDQTQAGKFGLELAFFRFCQMPGASAAVGSTLAVCGEAAFGGGVFLGVGGIFQATDPIVDEPIMFPSIVTTNSQAYPAVCEAGGNYYLAGDIVVWQGMAQNAPGGVIEALGYIYEDNTFDLTLPAISSAAAGIRVGMVLAVTRTLSWGAQSGSQTVRAMVVRVERGTQAVKVRAVDAVGWLGTARCRRPSILSDGSVANVAQVMRRLAGRFGVPVGNDNAALETGAVMPMTLMPAESLAGAAFRVGSQSEFYLVPANDGSFGLTMITPGTSGSGAYNDTAHIYGAGTTQQPISRAAEVDDYRRLAFAYVLGSRSTDPEDGGALGMGRGPVAEGTRPISYSLTNMRYNTLTRVGAAAAAEAARQRKLPVTAWIEGQANLALEVYDVVTVTEPRLGWSARQLRVRGIREEYDKGKLTQVVYLGEV
jgi:hypothetical protein